ncbi:glyoxalase/bleomycin resistance/extradiol dioxygenase family protein [Agromyces sp. Soil535]|uniref:VOC family protein n=1 Tax=Agromyces sp. Soil535 TaxID=1736390 RepID=UPI0006F92C50|nr:VOC family protein [Agromyces sp. Soil535]KRE28573.1 glyoxalase [Agromyces sp. Soil535]
MNEHNVPAIDRSIYPMPVFANLVVRDLRTTEAFYSRAGFVTLATIPGPGGVPQLVHLRRMKYQDLLVTQGEPAAGSVSVSFAAGDADLDAVAVGLRAAGADVEGPLDTPWFTTDLRFTDPDGNRIVFTAPRMADQEQARAWAEEGITGDFDAPDDDTLGAALR